MSSALPAAAATAGARCLGLPADRGRWWLLPLGLLMMLCLGSVYAWSIFRTPLEQELGLTPAGSLLPFTVVLVAYAALMPVAGYFLPRVGTRRMAAIGALVVGSGYGLASTASGLAGLLLGYGLIAGAGIGIVYGVPILVISRWFPDRKGLAVGMILVGFGLSPLLTAPLAQRSIEALSVRPTLRLFGLVIAALILLISPAMLLPPQGWQPRGHRTAATAGETTTYYPHRLPISDLSTGSGSASRSPPWWASVPSASPPRLEVRSLESGPLWRRPACRCLPCSTAWAGPCSAGSAIASDPIVSPCSPMA